MYRHCSKKSKILLATLFHTLTLAEIISIIFSINLAVINILMVEKIDLNTLHFRQVTRLIKVGKLRREMWFKELTGTLKPPPSLQLRDNSAELIQKVFR